MLDEMAVHEITLHIEPGSLDLIGGTREQGPEEYSVNESRFACRSEPRFVIPGPPPKAVAIGTTVVKALETFALTGNEYGRSDLYIRPPFQFRMVLGLLTNFHGPRQKLLELTCAFGGTDMVMRAYREAADRQYRFGDYGDQMLIL